MVFWSSAHCYRGGIWPLKWAPTAARLLATLSTRWPGRFLITKSAPRRTHRRGFEFHGFRRAARVNRDRLGSASAGLKAWDGLERPDRLGRPEGRPLATRD